MKRLILLFIAALFGINTTSFAQNEGKFSASTLQFISERDGERDLGALPTPESRKRNAPSRSKHSFRPNGPRKVLSTTGQELTKTRHIASPETVNGVSSISCFIGLTDNNFSALESAGVVIQAKFDKLCTAWIPVDKIEEIAELSNVRNIEVSEIMEPTSDVQRTVTQAYDAMLNTSAAQALGINSTYTGKGVILGVIDTGIDFQHIAFKDKDGNNRIVRAYKLSSSNSTSLTTYSTSSQISSLTYDTNDGDHGTHTVSTAGGSSVIVNGTNVSVTEDHANATYGGMAPEADLVVAGLSSLYTASIATAIQNICNYADQVGKPCVISLSLGSHYGPHDGSGSVAEVVSQYAGDNHIIVYAASNDAGKVSEDRIASGLSNGGGIYSGGTATSSKPWMAVPQFGYYSNADDNVLLYSPSMLIYNRTSNQRIGVKLHVIDVTTNSIVWTSSAFTSSGTISASSLSSYYSFSGSISVTISQESTYSNKYYALIDCPQMQSQDYSANSDGNYISKYALAVSAYPTSGSTTIDSWVYTGYCWYGDLGTTISGYNLVAGSDDGSASDNACYDDVISVGAYVSKNSITDYNGTAHDFSSEYPNIGDHAYFSSYNVEGVGPTGKAIPTINAPGARIVAGVNHYHTTSVDDYSYYGDDYSTDLVVNSTQYPYAAMEGTSMATPCVSGIIAQWLQACVEAGKTPTPDYIKEVMAATWDTDEWTNGTGSGAHGSKTFGNHGKINALKGIQYILGVTGGPTITATPTSLNFEGYTGQTYTKTLNVKGVTLEGDITATLNDETGTYSLSQTTISQSAAENGVDITVTYAPTLGGNTSASITLSSQNATNVVVSLSGTAIGPTITADQASLTFEGYTTMSYEQTLHVAGTNLSDDIALTLTDETGSFSLSENSVEASASVDGVDITVTYEPTTVGTHSATLTLSSAGADDVVVNLEGTAQDGTIRYTVTFNPGTGRVSPKSWTQEQYNQATTLPTAQSPDSDYSFVGWATASLAETTDEPTLLAAGASYQPTTDVTLYAVYSHSVSTGSGNYELVTSTPDDWSGTYLIVYTSGSLALKGSLTSNSTSNTLSVTISNNTIESNNTTDAQSFYIEPYGSGYSIKGASGRYIYGGSDRINYATSAYENAISLSGSDATITYNSSYSLMYYKGTRTKCFRYVTNTSNKTNAVQLYKKQPGTVTSYTSIPVAPSIGNIANIINDILTNTSSTQTIEDAENMANKILWKE